MRRDGRWRRPSMRRSASCTSSPRRSASRGSTGARRRATSRPGGSPRGGARAARGGGGGGGRGGGPRRSEGLSGEWSGWTDAGTRLAFDGNTTGSPPLRAADPAEFVVDAAFDRLIRYVALPDGPGEPPDGPGGTLPTPPNWKPALA